MPDGKSYAVQINVKVGDHLINVQGESADDAVTKLLQVANAADVIHEALTKLDGRPATEIVQKEKTWGARSQGGRSYPRGNQPSGQQYVEAALGATQTADHQQGAPLAHPAEQPPEHVLFCTSHGFGQDGQPIRQARTYYGPGTSKTSGKPYGASYRCATRGHDAVWANKDGSWPTN